jgi:hypothetical protein
MRQQQNEQTEQKNDGVKVLLKIKEKIHFFLSLFSIFTFKQRRHNNETFIYDKNYK